jgi:tRNA 2-thiouridine synthesizing protein E
MGIFSYKGKDYEIDSLNFLAKVEEWDKNFTEGMAFQLKIPQGLTKEHWDVINWIRRYFLEKEVNPNVYETCRGCGLRIGEMRKLFPTGYGRGALKLAGLVPGRAYHGTAFDPAFLPETMPFMDAYNKTYEIDVRGFLVNPDDWDEYYAIYRAREMKIPGGKLTDRHWKIIKFLRDSYQKNKEVPTFYETCDANQIDLEELEKLFPDGYHRNAIKLAGLRIGGPSSKRSKGATD